ncbi:DUF5336 domain-containing protein [Amycolatopsis taiwanensis]|uniref:34 kDa antigenic protein n=1 Tax=Amycolatopsis taiwanensis TaxID=342230 RepID=A0A9W6VC57_9PSEU|nr:DUF5336 domain-containing protein [Amycolatopsis taiwanensis]GLY63440.1 hypothetical protein Atai01_00590 [Amycolatopsis taiwanensis]
MTFPSGGPGYPQQGGGAQPNPQAPGTGGFPQQHAPVATLSSANLTVLLSLAVTLLGLINYFIAFSDETAGADFAIIFLLIGGLLAALRVLPGGPKVLPFVALTSVFGALWAILEVVRASVVPGIVTVILILGILQMLVAVATLLFDHGVLKMPAQRQQYPPYGQPYGQPTQPPQGPEQQAGPSGTQYGPPVTPPPGQTPQSTVYAPQQGQFYQPPSESGPQQQPPAGGNPS